MKNKKVLIISYYWPPFGGTGVYRILKFIKHLSQQGWEPIVLTPKKANARIIYEKLLEEVPSNTKVYYSTILEPSLKKKGSNSATSSGSFFLNKPTTLKGKIIRWVRLNIFIPDAKIGWYLYAISKGKEIIKKEQPSIILSTSPPPTTSLIANKLSKWSGLPWVADFRDPWTKTYYLKNISRFFLSEKLNYHFEKKVHQQSSAITVVNNGFFPHLEEFKSKTVKISNGFDRDDINDISIDNQKNERYTIRYFGGYKSNQYSEGFYNAIKKVYENDELKNNIKIEFYGYYEEFLREKFSLFEGMVYFKSYIPRSEALELMKKSDLVLLFISKGYPIGVSTKIFEYMMLERNLLAIGPLNGTADEIIQETNSGKMFSYDDNEGIYEFIYSSYTKWKDGDNSDPINKEAVNNYDFKELTKKLAVVFDNVIN